MNKVILMGRLTRNPEVRYSQKSDGTTTTVARYSLAVNRKVSSNEGASADFITCVAFGKPAEFAERYLKQGLKIIVTGHIQTGSYTNRDGQKVYTTDVIVEEHEFAESKNAQSGGEKQERETASDCGDGFINIPDGIEDEGLPFC